MAANEPKMKINVGADTSEFNKGIKQAKSDLKSFGNVSEDILGKLGSALGVDTKQVEQMASAIRGMGQKMEQAGSEGETAFSKIASAAKGAGASIAAIGIAAAVASFKLLNSEAEAFKNTIAGANIELQTKAYIDTYQQVFHDFNAGAAQNVAEWEANWKKGFARFKANFGQNVVNTLTGNTNMATAIAGPIIGSLFGDKEQMQAANTAAERAEQIAGRLYELQRQQSDASRTIADLDKRIAENREIMRDQQYSLNERLAAYRSILSDIEEKGRLQLPIEEERTALMDEMVGLAQSAPAAVDAANQQYVRQQSLSKSLTDEKASLLRYANSLFNQEDKITGALKEQLEIQKQIAQSREDLNALNLGVAGGIQGPNTVTSGLAGGGIIPQDFNPVAFKEQIMAALGDNAIITLGVEIDKEAVFDVSNQLQSIVSGMAESMSAAIGGLIGDLVTGGDAWANFGTAAMSAFGDMASSIGKIAVECGIAALGIEASLKLVPGGAAMAIAAGAALIALGAAVKAGLSNVATGNYSSGANVATSSYGNGGGDYETRDANVHVTGQLRADGDQLVAVIENTTDRNNYTT